MTIERIVRPFQTEEITQAKRIPPATGAAPQTVKLKIGRSGGGKTFHGNFHADVTVYNKKHPKETTTDESDFETGDGTFSNDSRFWE